MALLLAASLSLSFSWEHTHPWLGRRWRAASRTTPPTSRPRPGTSQSSWSLCAGGAWSARPQSQGCCPPADKHSIRSTCSNLVCHIRWLHSKNKRKGRISFCMAFWAVEIRGLTSHRKISVIKLTIPTFLTRYAFYIISDNEKTLSICTLISV